MAGEPGCAMEKKNGPLAGGGGQPGPSLHWPVAKITGPAAGQQGIAPVLTKGPVSFGAFFFAT